MQEQKLTYRCSLCQTSVQDEATSTKLKLHEEQKYVCAGCINKTAAFKTMTSCNVPYPWTEDQVYSDFVLKITYWDGGYHAGVYAIHFPMIKLFTLQDIDDNHRISRNHPHLAYYPYGYGAYSKIKYVEVIKKKEKIAILE